MVANLYPLIYKAGIKRDGTKFQSDYCTDGFWVRFQRGKIRRMGGTKGAQAELDMARVTDMLITPNTDRSEMLVFLCGEGGISVQVNSPAWDLVSNHTLLAAELENSTMWDIETVIDVPGQRTYIVFMQTKNALDINANTNAIFFRKDLRVATDNAAIVAMIIPGVEADSNSGLVFAAPYLFIYGSNGNVQYSKTNNAFDFREGDGSGSLTISTDKVIYAAPIRGGENSPTILFWTLSSVVRVTNVRQNVQDFFRNDVLSNSSSIISSKCVVEYDGLFFWPGTERFFVYNGVVQEMDNQINLNYFYDNVDMDRRQQIFGVKQTKYGEIWWFYPERGVEGANSRALIYNKRENSWYDTAISRTAGVFSSDFGFMSTYGKFIVPPPNADEVNVWWHDWQLEPNERGYDSQNGEEIIGEITSNITTPTISWASFPPKFNIGDKSSKLVNRWIDLQRIEPDFVKYTDDEAGIRIRVNTQEYALSPVVSTNYNIITDTTGKVDMRVQGRNMTLTIQSTDLFELGEVILLLSIGDGR